MRTLKNVVLAALLLVGCQKRAYRQAAVVHREAIAAVAAYAPLLRLPPPQETTPAERYAARVAREELLRRISSARDHLEYGVPAHKVTPTGRLALGLDQVVRACYGGAGLSAGSAAERALLQACLQQVGALDALLGQLAQEAQRQGLARGWFPALAEAAGGEVAQRAAELQQRTAATAAERLWVRLAQDPYATDAGLRSACEAAEAAVAERPEEVRGPQQQACALLRAVLDVESAYRECLRAVPRCLRVSHCESLRLYAQKGEELPRVVHDRLSVQAAACESALRDPRTFLVPADGGVAPGRPDGGAPPDGGSPPDGGTSGRSGAAPRDGGAPPDGV